MKIKNVIFDLDNTLINSEEMYESALKVLGLNLNHVEYLSAREKVKLRLPKNHSSARNRFLYFKILLEEKKQFSPQKLLEMMSQYEDALFEHALKQVRNLGRHKMFQEFKSRGFKLALLTNENLRTQMVKIRALDPEGKYFDYVLVSEEVGFEKPHEIMFSELFLATGWNKDETILVGDDLVTDIEGGKAYGLKVVQTIEFEKGSQRRDYEPDQSKHPVIKKLEELNQYV